MADLRALLVCVGALAGAGLPGHADTPTLPRQQALAHLVKQDCGACHGMTRKGGLGSPITPEALAGADAAGLAAIILDGIPGTAMPPWRPLISEADALWIANHLLTEPAP